MKKRRTAVESLESRDAARTLLLNRARRISHALSGIRTGAAATIDHRRESLGVDRRPGHGPSITGARRAQLVAALAAGAPPPSPSARAVERWEEWRAHARRPEFEPGPGDELPPSFGIPTRDGAQDRGTLQRVAGQAAKCVSALESCGHWRGVYSCPNHGAWAATSRCGHRLCVPCSVVRRSEMLARYRPFLAGTNSDPAAKVPMLTLTQEGRDGAWLADEFDRLTTRHRAFTRAVSAELTGTDCTSKKARKAARADRRHVGGLTGLEATPRPCLNPDPDRPAVGRWNAHAHVLLREPAHVPDEWTVPGWTGRPLDPWRFRFLWASCLLDGRTSADRSRLSELRAGYRAGRERWLRKMRARERKAEARARETAELRRWEKTCRRLGVPAVVDLRHVHPAEGLKYITKGFSADGGDAPDEALTDWHLWQILLGTYYLRRSIPWGSLYRLPKPDEVKEPEETDHRPCPHCQTMSAPIPRAQWRGSRAVPDYLLMAYRLDRAPFVPRGPPAAEQSTPPELRSFAQVPPPTERERPLWEALGGWDLPRAAA